MDLLERESVEMPVLLGKGLEGGYDAADLEQRTLAALIENSNDFIGVASLEGQAMFVNPAGRTLVGLESDEQVRASRMSDYIIEEDRHRFLQEALPAVVMEGRWDGEMRFRHFQSGAAIPMLQQLFLIREEGCRRPLAFATISRDITQRTRTATALHRSEERFRSYFELGLIGMASTSPTRGIFEVNDELCSILGHTRDELLHKSWTEITHPDDLAPDVAQFNRVLAGETDGYTMDKRFIRKDGRVIDTIMAARCLRRADRSVDHFVALVLDTTERKRAEAAVQKLQRELAHVSRVTLMGELASSIAHEINQPLGAIVNNSKVCLRFTRTAPGLPQDVREALADIAEDANRTSAIIARLRALISRSTPEATSLRLTDVVAEVLLLAHRELVERHITVRTDFSDALPKVCGDRVQLQQVLLNLVMNGCDAMSELPEARRLLLLAGHGDSLAGQPAVLMTVRDFGHGFKPEDTERLFEAFYSTRPHGMGMGLSISRFIVEAHGGQLRASLNSDGPGATFLVLLPAPDQNPTHSHP